MMTEFVQCDRCGKPFTPYRLEKGDYALRRVEYSDSSKSLEYHTLLLCPTCMNKIKIWADMFNDGE